MKRVLKNLTPHQKVFKKQNSFLRQNVLKVTKAYLNVRRIILLTTNQLKYREYLKNFELYGIGVQLESPVNKTEEDFISLLSDPKCISILKDDTYLFKAGTTEKADVDHLELVDNVTHLNVRFLNKSGELVKTSYEHTTRGYIDILKKKPYPLGVFGFDDVFTVLHTGNTYLEMDKLGQKISARDMVLSKYIKDRFYYKKKLDLNFEPLQLEGSIDFSKSVSDYLKNHDLFTNEWTEKFKLSNMFEEMANRGVVFKSSKNRREKNYFSTLVNPAIPLVAKRDRVHQSTFMAHDLGHFHILELLYTGEEETELQKLVYITYRMISEAATMMIADVLFAESLKRSKIEYEYQQRKIHPLYSESNLDIDRDGVVNVLKKLIKANVEFCCKGNEEEWKKLLGDNFETVFGRFKQKFEPFFIEDYRWNVENYENMSKRKKTMKIWWNEIKPMRDLTPDVPMYSIDDFIVLMTEKLEKKSAIPTEKIVDLVLETMMEKVILPVFEKDKVEPFPNDRKLYNCFLRYMIGQFALFSQHDSLSETKIYRDNLLQFLREKSKTKSISLKEIKNAMKFYSSYVDILLSKNLISLDDSLTYKEKLFSINSSSLEKSFSSSRLLFAFTFSLSCLIFEFIIFELLNFFPIEIRSITLRLVLFIMIINLLIILPFSQFYLSINIGKYSIYISIFLYFVYIYFFWKLIDPLDNENISLLESALSRISIIGVTSIAVFSGFGAVYWPMSNIGMLTTHNIMDTIQIQKQFDKTQDLIKLNQKKLENFEKHEDNQTNANFFSSFFRSKQKNEKEIEFLKDQIQILENVAQDISFELKEAKEDEKFLKFSQSTFGKIWRVVAYIFSFYCIYKIFMSFINIIFRREISKIDPVERIIQFISIFILRHEIDVQYWSHQVNFILTSLLIFLSIRSLLLNLHKV
eukprot:gene5368-9176_t